MIDIHSHLLYGLDDGPSKIDESIKMLIEAANIGIKEIVCTSHYHVNLYEYDRATEYFNKLTSRARDFGITLKLGYEVYASTLNYKNLNKVNCLTLGQSRYLLVEFPFSEFPEHGCEMLYELYLRGIVPIISHPERCHLFRDNFQLIDSLLESGCLLQVDAASIIGVYGWGTKNFAKKLIKENKVHFVASNAHFSEDYREWFLQARKKIIHIAGVEQANLLFNGNADRILKVEVVPTMDINNG